MTVENNYKELEYKYNAEKVSLVDFVELMKSLGFKEKVEVSSWDVYYNNEKDEFIRFRKSDNRPELTTKRKTTDINNADRIEVNIPLSDKCDEATTEAFVNLLEFKKNFKIYKSCFIYFFDEVNTVYYTVYDENMIERGRFIEIEFDTEMIPELGEEKAFEILKCYEQHLSKLNITPQHRLRKSLYEMFKND